MKTFTAPLQQNRQLETIAGQKLIPLVKASIGDILAMLSAVTAATAIVLISVWVVGMGINDILGAGSWGLAFIFLGLAVDNREPTAGFQLATGISLLILSGLQNTVSPDFSIISGALVATWVAVLMFKRLR